MQWIGLRFSKTTFLWGVTQQQQRRKNPNPRRQGQMAKKVTLLLFQSANGKPVTVSNTPSYEDVFQMPWRRPANSDATACYILCDFQYSLLRKVVSFWFKSHKNRHIPSKIGQQFNLLPCINCVEDHIYKNPKHSSFREKENFQSRSLTKGVLSTLVDSIRVMHTHDVIEVCQLKQHNCFISVTSAHFSDKVSNRLITDNWHSPAAIVPCNTCFLET